MGPYNSFGMEDATAAVAFRKYNIDSTTTLFAVGDKVSGTFKKADFNGLIQAELQEDAPTVEAGPHALTLEKVDLGVVGLTAEALAPYQSRLVTGELTVKTIAAKDGSGNITLLLTDGVKFPEPRCRCVAVTRTNSKTSVVVLGRVFFSF